MVLNQTVAAILRHEPETERNCLLRVGDGNGLAEDGDLRVNDAAPGAIDRQRRLDASRAQKTEKADDLAPLRPPSRSRRL